MARISNRGRALIGSLGALAVGATLFSMPAAAGTGNGSFFVHSQSGTASARTFDGYAPRIPKGGSSDGDSGGGSVGPTPGTTSSPTPSQGTDPSADPSPSTPPAVSLATYRCGPMSLELTDQMVELDRSNRAIAAQSGATNSSLKAVDGWKFLSYNTDETSSKLLTGSPGQYAEKLTDLYLSPTTELPSTRASAWQDPAWSVAFMQNYADSCKNYDTRRAPQAGATFGYQWTKDSNGYTNVTESRYLQEDGGLQPVHVYQPGGPGSVYVARTAAPNSFLKAANSDVYPASIGYRSGTKTLAMAFTEVRDSYDSLNATYNEDGSGFVLFTNWDRKSSRYGVPLTLSVAPRKAGPTEIYWDKDGNFTKLTYSSGTDRAIALSAPYTVAHYNQVTGQKWDGSYPKQSDFNASVPFRPTVGR